MRPPFTIGTIFSAAFLLCSGCAPPADSDQGNTMPEATAALAPYQVVADWPSLPEGFDLGTETNSDRTPGATGVDLDSQGRVWVLHRGMEQSVVALDPETGEILASFGGGMFLNAHGLAVDGEDNIWITDTNAHQVHKFSPDGELLLTLGEREVAGLDEGHFDQPTAVAVAPSGEIFVSDGYGNSRVVKFAADGTFLMDWGEPGDGPGQFTLPHGLALDDQGRLYVADRNNMRIQVFTSDGEFIDAWSDAWTSDDWGRPWGLEVTSDGELFVIDGGHGGGNPSNSAKLLRMSLDGEILETWSSYGDEPGQLSWGHDVAVGEDGAVYTVEVQHNPRIQKFVRGGM